MMSGKFGSRRRAQKPQVSGQRSYEEKCRLVRKLSIPNSKKNLVKK